MFNMLANKGIDQQPMKSGQHLSLSQPKHHILYSAPSAVKAIFRFTYFRQAPLPFCIVAGFENSTFGTQK